MKQATLCLFVKESEEGKELLLAIKKRGFGAGKWNGVGGKPDLKKGDKTLIDTAMRETEEEIGVRIKNMKKVALLNFRFPYKLKEREKWDQDVHVFLVDSWEGEPFESEEMLPKWFKEQDIPFEEMWDDDKIWLPEVLEGKKLEADFVFEPGEVISGYNIRLVDGFE